MANKLDSYGPVNIEIWKQEQFEAEVSANDMYLEAKTGQTWFEKQGKLSCLPGIYLLRSRNVFPIQVALSNTFHLIPKFHTSFPSNKLVMI